MENPVGTGAYRLKQWTRGQRILLEANPDYRESTFPAPGPDSAPGDAAIAQGLDGQEAAARRQRGHLDHRGGAAAASVVRFRPARLRRAAGDALPPTCSTARRSSPNTRSAASRCTAMSRRRSRSSTSTSTTRWSAGTRRKSSRCGARSAWGYDREKAISSLLHGQAASASQPVPPPLYGHDPKYVRPTATTRARARTARQVRLQGPRRRRLARAARRQAADPGAGLDARQCRARQRRAVEAEHGRARPQDHVPQEQVARA